MKFTQQFFQPGWWNVNGSARRFTKGELSDRCDNTDAFIQANPAGGVPIFPSHPTAGSDAGGPRLADRDARDCLGWVDSTRIDAAGKCHVTYDVQDQRTIDGINNGSIRFSSPEFSAAEHIDSKGKNHGKIFRHFSMTAAPRNREQGPITSLQCSEDCFQFTEDDFMGTTKKDVEEKAAQFAHADDPKKLTDNPGDTVAVEEANPTPNADELPTNDAEVAVADEHPDQSALNGLVTQLQDVMGIMLPDGADAIAVLTAILNTAKAKKDAEAVVSGDLDIQEEPVAQFSEAATAVIEALEEKNRVLNVDRLAASLVKHRASVTAAISTASIPKRLKSRLAERANSLQFSESGEEEPVLRIQEAIALYEECIPKSIQFAEGDVDEAEHPDKTFFDKGADGGEESDASADKGVDEQLKSTGFDGSGFSGKSPAFERDFARDEGVTTAAQ